MKLFGTSLVLLPLLMAAGAVNTKLKEIFAWKEVDYAFPSAEARQMAVDKETFIPANSLPLGLDVTGDRLFITVPRWKKGIPSALNYIRLNNETLSAKSPALTPYPDWESNMLPEEGVNATSSTVISPLRLRVDSCKRLWVMDTGVADIFNEHRRYTNPKLLVYDLRTDSLLRSFVLKDEDVKEDSFFANVVVDVCGQACDEAHAYLPDLGSNSLVVYSWKEHDSWRITHHFFHFDPLQGDYNVGGVNFQWTDGLFSLALTPTEQDCSRTVYFHPMSSSSEFAVSNKVLQNRTAAADSYHEYRLLGSRGNNSQSTASFLHEKSGVLFYTLLNKNGVGCWNTHQPFSEQSQGVVAQDDDTLVFVNDLKVCNNDNLWVLSDKLPIYMYKKLNPEEINYRVLMAPVTEAVKDTVCE